MRPDGEKMRLNSTGLVSRIPYIVSMSHIYSMYNMVYVSRYRTIGILQYPTNAVQHNVEGLSSYKLRYVVPKNNIY